MVRFRPWITEKNYDPILAEPRSDGMNCLPKMRHPVAWRSIRGAVPAVSETMMSGNSAAFDAKRLIDAIATANAVAWTRAHAAAFGGDPRRLFLMGHSAGRQITTLLALDGSYLWSGGFAPRAIAGVVGLACPYDFLPLPDATLKAVFGGERDWPRSQPINFVTRDAPPMLLLTGEDDETVDPGTSRRLAARLQAAGDAAGLTVYPWIGHKTLIGALASPLAFLAPVRKDVLSFVAGTSGNDE